MLESPEITQIVDPAQPDVLHYSKKRKRYEIRFSRRSIGENLRLLFDRKRNVFHTWNDHIARTIPEWELYADPDTYARLKTRQPR